ncbi:unnamed protein product [Bursaphelenchus xylophilus]|uniref:(pine wood nematode) hypothetical protein n=1 Tax=Bursaphelenchus xylophilus TaxID=6326 RepID=A0A1I7ST42_BURXY|nr:unnamed protein product [Bursaphelenchus xylophilus]CAG9108745.1 unnamed protein product [Bursaphelenchus xylophilus]
MFVLAVYGMYLQLFYLWTRNRSTTVSYRINVQHFKPFTILLCSELIRGFPFPSVRDCNGAANFALVSQCNVILDRNQFQCQFSCIWTPTGYCVKVIGAITRALQVPEKVEYYRLSLSVQDTLKLSKVYIFYSTDTLNTVRLPVFRTPSFTLKPGKRTAYEVAGITGEEDADRQWRNNFCVWNKYNFLANSTNCNGTRLYSGSNGDDEIYEKNPCTLGLAARAVNECHTRAMSSLIVGYTTYSISSQGTGNESQCDITARNVYQRRHTVSSRQGWQILSEIGGTLSLYTSFTLMAGVEILFFFLSKDIRKDVDRYDLLLTRLCPPAMKAITLLLLVGTASGCISSAPRQFSATPDYSGAAAQAQRQFIAPLAQGQAQFQQQVAAAGAGLPRAAAAENVAPAEPIASSHLAESEGPALGQRVSLTEFSSNGYNSAGGGPVNKDEALSCDFEGRPCCWANAPTPDDQIDWQHAAGTPDVVARQNMTMQGRYLLAHAVSAAPSDEAQFVSCAIACASSPIKVRATHFQSHNVLLQVCQRESFPNSVDYNPLLNCQEFPSDANLKRTELVLPKASLVDIVFVASNFVDREGSLAILDDIEIDYESDPSECPLPPQQSSQSSESTQSRQSSSRNGFQADRRSSQGFVNVDGSSDAELSAIGAASGSSAVSVSRGSVTNIDTATGDQISINSVRTSSLSNGNTAAKALGTPLQTDGPVIFDGESCRKTKCNFEDGTICSYVDKHSSESLNGLSTKFQVVKGQFMNRVTGIKDNPEGDYYAASFLYPKEKAVLASDVGAIDESSRIKFKYYEGTHGVQLKGCCDSIDKCPFNTDRFVTVGDREWKSGDFVCSRGTKQVLFFCENTRTNQGACALDDVQVVDANDQNVENAKPLC